MDADDFKALRVMLALVAADLAASNDLAEQLDLHAASAKRRLAEARAEFDLLEAKIKRAIQ
jgi:hypothetical protein